MTTQKRELQRATFVTSRELEFTSAKELQAQTGQPEDAWPLVFLKEASDNALDACEEAKVSPIVLTISIDSKAGTLSVKDNGPGIPAETVASVLDFSSRTSSREAYVSPTRGAQGNALKTVLAMPFAAILRRSILSRRDHACEMVETICRIGGDIVRGRMRPSGKRSRPTLRTVLHAPELRQHMPKRNAEMAFVVRLANAWEAATGRPPARTADRRAPGPFARFVQQSLDRVGAKDAIAVKLINRLGRGPAVG